MKNALRTILVPVDITDSCLSVARQAAELARIHGASVHLLHVADKRTCRNKYFPWLVSPVLFADAVREKTAMLDTWKRWLERDYTISVSAAVSWGAPGKAILRHARQIRADMIALSEHQEDGAPRRKVPAEYIVSRSPCQVITIFSSKESLFEWKEIVLPVTDFIPELRIRTIMDIARVLKLKVHLVTTTTSDFGKRSTEFYYLTETLKRLKQAAHIQVECSCIKRGFSGQAGFLEYARTVNADLLMTNLQPPPAVTGETVRELSLADEAPALIFS